MNNDELYDRYVSFPLKTPFHIVKFIRDYIPEIELVERDISQKGISGFIKEENDGKIYICVHQFDNKNRKRFTIAHELGHYFRHRDKIKEGFVDGIGVGAFGRDTAENKVIQEEIDANEFAGEILMPEVEFKNIYNYKKGNITAVAEFFMVSEAAAYTRAKLLGFPVNDYCTYFM